MATTTGSKKSTTGNGSKKAKATRPSTRAASSRATAPGGRKRPSVSRSTPRRSKKSSQRGPFLGGHAHDVAGLTLVAVGLLAAFGIYGDLAGPAGRSLATATATAVGRARYLVPPALVALGLVLLVRRPRENAGRLFIGAALLAVAVAGLVHLIQGSPSMDASVVTLRSAGGLVGGAIASPLSALLAGGGAAVVLLALGGVGAVVLARTDVRHVGALAVRATRAVGAAMGRGIRTIRARTASADSSPAGTAAGPDGRPPTPLPLLTNPDLVAQGDSDEPDEAAEPDGSGDGEPEPPTLVHVPTEPEPEPEQLAIDLGPAAVPDAWKLPSLADLKRGSAHEIDQRLVEAEGRTLESALAAHGVDTRLVGMTVGPTVTRFELALGPGVKVARVTNLHRDIAYAMASPDVRILAPIPGRSAIGVEVPNKVRQLVLLGDILASPEAHKATHPLEVAIGRDIAGRPVMVNLAEMPHVLIAGATGAGKSSCINSLISSILMRATPEQVRMILIDPKRVELGQYNGLPHLLTQVVVNPKRAANALSWAVREMERRYDLLAEVGARDIGGYNAAWDRGELRSDPAVAEGADGTDGAVSYKRLPFVIVVVDELNDLMMVAARDVEESICRIAQMARAVGIHLVIATQRPSVDVITGVIKANVPSRMAFAVSSQADSRVILDQMGAERLVGQGDMLLAVAASNVPRRVQGAWVGEDEVRKVVAHWRRQAQPDYVAGVEGDDTAAPGGGGAANDDDDDLLESALDLVVRSQLGSTSMLQRKLRVGFARAGRLMDLLERRGVVAPSEGSKARAVLMTVEELDERHTAAPS
ncbi:MAG: DNA translocase FtsK [Actinomycetota bacterium]|nr:DNA translocase FtsK [Actinomycetota bacterium]